MFYFCVCSVWLRHSNGGRPQSPVLPRSPHLALPPRKHGVRPILPALQPVHGLPGGVGSLQRCHSAPPAAGEGGMRGGGGGGRGVGGVLPDWPKS